MGGSWVELSRSALAANVGTFRTRLGHRALMAVVKANAYGHGVSEIAPVLAKDVDWFGVDSLAEARPLRELTPRRPVLILGHTEPGEADEIVATGFRPCLFRRDVAEALAVAARRQDKRARVHLKLETGLHRLGVTLDELEHWKSWLEAHDELEVEGLYTHLVDVEDPDSTLVAQQLAKLKQARRVLESSGRLIRWVHASPTAGVLLSHDEALNPFDAFNMGRVGIGLYGIWPSAATRKAFLNQVPDGELIPVLSWKCRLAQTKQVERGATVGYEATYRAASGRRIGVVPVGYYDGLDRKLSNRGVVLVRARRCAIVGRVAMNMIMVDVTDTGAQADDEVTLIGEQGNETSSAQEMAETLDTIPYEVLARLSPRIPRHLVD